MRAKEDSTMSQPQMDGRTKRSVVVAIVAVLIVAVCILQVPSQEAKPKVFGSPEEAMKALAEAAQAGDRNGLLAILGSEAEDILSSGDEVADKAARNRFLKSYQEKMDLVRDGDLVAVILGDDNWPFPIPIMKEGEGWVFDTAAGKEEVSNRRIGRNELNTIEVCQGYVDAQREYVSVDRDLDGVMQYARKFLSDPDQRNGLYWPVVEGETPSPFGPLVAEAAAAGYKKKTETPIPYYGYYYKILRGQGASAPGGAYSYVINGHMVAGFALVAWPADYGNSGIMTFVVNQNGTVYEKDLGPGTAQAAKAMTLYNPDSTWRKAE